jgi:hypothetical protein
MLPVDDVEPEHPASSATAVAVYIAEVKRLIG